MSDNMASRLKRQVYAKKFTGYIVLAAIGMVFVFFGYGGRGGGMLGIGSVARVNNHLISMADFQNEENRIQQYYAQMFGGAIDFSQQKGLLRQQAMENLIRGELVAQAAKKEGIMATDLEVRDFIVKDIPVFQVNGQFQRDRYMGYLESTRTSAADFENRVRKDIATLRTRHLVELSALPMSLELAKVKELQENKMNVAFGRLETDELAKAQKFSDAELKAKLADGEFQKKAEEYFRLHNEEWARPETVKAQHILISAKAGDAAAEKKALDKIKEIAARTQKEDFGKLAAQFSEDPGSKDKKGMLEPFSRGRMVKEFEDVAFVQKPGTISEPVKSQFGYHLIKVVEKNPGYEPKFDDVKMQVAGRLLGRDKVEETLKKIDEETAKGDLAKVDELMKSIGAKWEETGLFDLGGDAVPRLPAGPVASSVFEVSEKKPFLNRVVRDGGARYVIKFIGLKKEPTTLTAKTDETLQRRRAEGIYNSWLNQFREKSRVEMNTEVLRQ